MKLLKPSSRNSGSPSLRKQWGRLLHVKSFAIVIPLALAGAILARAQVIRDKRPPQPLASPTSGVVNSPTVNNPKSTGSGVSRPGRILRQTVLNTIDIVPGADGFSPQSVAVLPALSRVYVTNNSTNNVSVINSATRQVVTSVPVGSSPRGVAASSANLVYVANNGGNSVSVINTGSNTVQTTIAVGGNPEGVAFNSTAKKIYVANYGFGSGNTVSVIDADPANIATFNTVVATVTTSNGPFAVGVNSVTNRWYVACTGNSSVEAYTGATNSLIGSVAVGLYPEGVTVDTSLNKVYIANNSSDTVSVFTDTLPGTPIVNSIAVGIQPVGIAANSTTNRVFVCSQFTNEVEVINSTNDTVVATPTISIPFGVAVNTSTNEAYVTSRPNNALGIIAGATNTVSALVLLGTHPRGIAANPATNKIYVGNAGNGFSDGKTASVIDGATNTVNASTIPLGLSNAVTNVAINPNTNRIYLMDEVNAGTVSVVNGATDAEITTIAVGGGVGIAVNPSTNRIYAADGSFFPGKVFAIDGTNNTVLNPAGTIVGGNPTGVGVDTGLNRIYVANSSDGTVNAIDGTTNNVIGSAITVGTNPTGVAVNSTTHRVYVTNTGSGTVSVINSNNNTVVTTINLPAGTPQLAAVNSVTNKVYVANVGTSNVCTIIDGATNTVVDNVSVGSGPFGVAANEATSLIYVTNYTDGTVTVIYDPLSTPTSTVFTTADNGNNATPTPGSLRAAILAANARPGTTIIFRISGSGPFVIAPPSDLPAITAPTTIDGYSQAGASANSLANGFNGTLQIVVDGQNARTNGLSFGVGATGSAVKGLVVHSFTNHNVETFANNITIRGNFVGCSVTGNTNPGNVFETRGVAIFSTGNTIGGTAPADRNILSGNREGVVLFSDGNTVQGNYIGTDKNGTAQLTNQFCGIFIQDASNNTIGGTSSAARNVISGNGTCGIALTTFSGQASPNSNLIQGNFIGPNVTGNASLPNGGDGIVFQKNTGSPTPNITNNTIGGAVAGAGNVISGNAGNGINFSNAIVTGNTVQGNYVGLNAGGTAAMGNSGNGISLSGGSIGNTIGGLSAAPVHNVISGNSQDGVLIAGAGTNSNLVQGCLIGLNAAGTASLANGGKGVEISGGAQSNTVGGTTLVGGWISGNTQDGVLITGANTNLNVVQGNNIGTNVAVNASIANGTNGVQIQASAQNNTVGSTVANGANVISGNTQKGVRITGSSTNGNVVLGNRIGTDNAGASAIANGGDGVTIDTGAQNNTIGGTAAGAKNVISGNGTSGIGIGGSGTTGNLVQGNHIGTNLSGASALPNAGSGVAITTAASNVIGGTVAAARNVISGNTGHGVVINANSNVVQGNYVGIDVNGTAAVANGIFGVAIAGGSTNNTIGGTVAGARNVISGNSNIGLEIRDTGTTGNLAQGNYIGTNAAGTAALGNAIDGARIVLGAQNNTIGGTAAGSGNVISGNNGNGVEISLTGTSNNLVQGNSIGTNAAGSAALGNTASGVALLSSAANNTIGGTVAGARNLISGNVQYGLALSSSASGNLVQGNYIGIDVNGSIAVANGTGVVNSGGVGIDNSSNNTIGGNVAAARNVISGNSGLGVGLQNSSATGNVILGNFIGTDANGTASLGNSLYGVGLRLGAQNNTIGGNAALQGNVIANNSLDGVGLTDSTTINNRISGNSIHDNARLGINLVGGTENAAGVTTNDPLDPDTGPNKLQNYAVLSSAQNNGSNTIVSGNLDSATANSAYPITIEFFSSVTADPSGYGEGQTFLGSLAIAGPGNFTTTTQVPAVPIGRFVTATATDNVGNTSEFSNVCPVVSGSGGPAGIAVTTTADSGAGSLRQAILTANAQSGSTITFKIPTSDPGFSGGVFTIKPTTALPSIATPTIIDGTTQTQVTGDTNAAGPEVMLDGSLVGAAGEGLVLSSANCTVRGLVINAFRDGILLTGATNCSIKGCYIGVNAAGTAAVANVFDGIHLQTSNNNTIGGTTAADRNIISGNTDGGIDFASTGSPNSGNVVQGNYIGTNAAGTAAIPNQGTGDSPAGIGIIAGSNNNLIGGTGPGAGNVISGNSIHGVFISGTSTSGNQVLGNFIGTSTAGTAAVANSGNGISISSGANNNTIGGTAAGAKNVISGNTQFGVRITDSGTNTNLVQGNSIGVDATGNNAIVNSQGGVLITSGAQGNLIGPGNLISGNAVGGMTVTGSGTNTNTVKGNTIGLSSGGSALGNGNPGYGVSINGGAQSNTIGGTTTGDANVISGHTTEGVDIRASGTNGNKVCGNFIGTNAAGTAALGNSIGVHISNSASSNTIGGSIATARNLISGNAGAGVLIQDGSTTGNLVQGNFIGTDSTGNSAIANFVGVKLDLTAQGNTIGGTTSGAGNVISGNMAQGLLNFATGTAATCFNSFYRNLIGTKADGISPLGNGAEGVLIEAVTAGNSIASDNNVGRVGDGNTIAFNTLEGVTVVGAGQLPRNKISGNSIHDNGKLGINLVGGTENAAGVTTNDAGDADTGPNTLQNYPVLSSAQSNGSNTIVGWNLDSTAANVTYPVTLEFFANAAADPSGYGEGQTFLGARTANGPGSFTFSDLPNVPAGQFITATATSRDAVNDGNTSEFSNVCPVVAGNGGPVGIAVTNTNDSGPGSLRQAILTANTQTGATITFKIPVSDPGFSGGLFTIKPATALPPITANGTTIDGTTQTAFTTDTNPNGPEIVLNGSLLAGSVLALSINSSNNTLKGVVINGFPWIAVLLTGSGATGNRVQGCYLGTDAAGASAVAIGSVGIELQAGASNNTIGGINAGEGNVISATGPGNCGVAILDAGTNNNTVLGNLLGTNRLGTFAIPNNAGVCILSGAQNNTIGGTVAGAGNVISGNTTYGVFVSGTGSSGNQVLGNFIGTNAAGAASIANGQSGVAMASGAQSNTIGGTVAGAKNIISGNSQQGILITDSGTNTNVVRGNFIGTNAAGTGALANNQVGVVITNSAQNNTIGGTTPARRNVVSGNGTYGIRILSSSSGNQVQGNFVGTDAGGTAAVGNGNAGVRIEGSSGNTVGGIVAGAPNTIAFNGAGGTGNGVTVLSGTGNAIRQNSIFSNQNLGIDLADDGVTTNDPGDLDTGPNNLQNYPVLSSAQNNGANTIVGGNLDSATANSAYPITIEFFSSNTADPSGYGEGQTFLGSLSVAGPGNFATTTQLAAVAIGKFITATATDNNGNTSEFSNVCPVVSGSGGPVGIAVTTTNDSGPGSLRQAILTANAQPGTTIVFKISTGDPGPRDSGAFVIKPTSALPTITANGIIIDGTTETTFLGSNPNTSGGPPIVINGSLAGGGVNGLLIQGGNCVVRGLVINGCSASGVLINGASATGCLVAGCFVGVNSAGNSAVPNSLDGVALFAGPANNTIGGTAAADRNLLSGNNDAGIGIHTSTGTVVLGNFIGTDVTGTAAVPNQGQVDGAAGIVIFGGVTNSVIGGTGPGARNVISGNNHNGVLISDAGTNNNHVQGNFIGTNAAGNAALGNSQNGIKIANGAQTNTIGGTTLGAGNVISGNLNGIRIEGSGTSNNVVNGNFIGTNSTGNAAIANSQNGIEIVSSASNNTIGGATSSAGNLISGNTSAGVSILNGGTTGNLVQGNFIGTDVNGTAAMANNVGVKLDSTAQGNTVGGTVSGAGNVISGNATQGILNCATGPAATCFNSFYRNLIGTKTDGVSALGNGAEGVRVEAVTAGNSIASDNTIGRVGDGNTIAFNTLEGVIVVGAGQLPRNKISGNSIHSNGKLGINLAGGTENAAGVTTNDPGDADPGPNNLQNYPLLSSAQNNGSNTIVSGNLDTATANAVYPIIIEFFASATADPSGFGEGKTFIGSLSVNAPGNFTTSNQLAAVAAGQFITATANDSDQGGNTSEFSNVCPVISALVGGANLVVNGNFDVSVPSNGTGGGWTSSTIDFAGGWRSSGGNPGGSFILNDSGQVGTDPTISQLVTGLSSGQTYRLTGDFAVHVGGPTQSFAIDIDGVNLAKLGSPGGFSSFSFDLVANDNDFLIAFRGEIDGSDVSYLIDNISLVPLSGAGPPVIGIPVTNTNDSGPGSLRQAILTANAQPGSTITFKIATSDPGPRDSGAFVIKPTSALPTITANSVTIDGKTETTFLGSNPNTSGGPPIVINGALAGANATGLRLLTSNGTIAGLVINGWSQYGVWLDQPTATGNAVKGCYIGLNAAGTAAVANFFDGIVIDHGASTNTVGGTTATDRNVVSGNGDVGIYVAGAGNIMQGNFVGTDATGMNAVPNGTLENFGGITLYGLGTQSATNNLIGGTVSGARNVIAGNPLRGVLIIGSGATGNQVCGNYIGVNAAGTGGLSNGTHGVEVSGGSHSNTIGGATAGSKNLISGNAQSGVLISGSGTNNNLVLGNCIGTNSTGTAAIANAVGVRLDATAQSNTIGGATAGASNVISGNTQQGILNIASGSAATCFNSFFGNKIGTKTDGTSPLGNGAEGVRIEAVTAGNSIASDNNVGNGAGNGNVIAFNTLEGVLVTGAGQLPRNRISRNSIHDNGKLGINLAGGSEDANGVTANDNQDPDTGPNNLQNYPQITGALRGAGNITISGLLNSAPNSTFNIEFFSNTAVDPSGSGEGETFLGTATVTTDPLGNAPFTVALVATVAANAQIAATATDSSGNTSEFSGVLLTDVAAFSMSLDPGVSFVTFPCDVSLNPADLFGASRTNFLFAAWDPTVQQYVIFNGNNINITRGTGYWVKLTAAQQVLLNNCDTQSTLRWNLRRGWNNMGNGFAVDLPWRLADIRVIANNQTNHLIDVATSTGDLHQLVATFAWVFDHASTSYRIVVDPSQAANVPASLGSALTSIPAGSGAWIFCNQDNVALEFDRPAGALQSTLRSASLSGARNSASARLAEPRLSMVGDNNRWITPIEVSAGSATDRTLSLGFNTNQATTVARTQKPPIAPTDVYVDAAFVPVDGPVGVRNTRYASDVRRNIVEGEAWEFVVTTNAQSEDVQVRWPSLGTLPRAYRLSLVDLASGARRSMRTTTGYVFHSDRGITQRRFRIELGANGGTNLQMVNVQLSRVGQGYQVAYSITKEAEVTGRLLNAAGKVIATVPVTRARSGLNSMLFEAKDALGRQTARGVYLFELVAQNDEGEQVKAVKSVVVR